MPLPLFKDACCLPLKLSRENFLLTATPVPYHRLDRDKTPFDKVRGDYDGPKVFDPIALTVPVFIDLVPSEATLERWGFQASTPGELAVFNAAVLKELELVIEPGDVMIVNGKEKEIISTEDADPYGTPDCAEFIHRVANITTMRKSSIWDERADTDIGDDKDVVVEAAEVLVADGLEDGKVTYETDIKIDEESDVLIYVGGEDIE